MFQFFHHESVYVLGLKITRWPENDKCSFQFMKWLLPWCVSFQKTRCGLEFQSCSRAKSFSFPWSAWKKFKRFAFFVFFFMRMLLSVLAPACWAEIMWLMMMMHDTYLFIKFSPFRCRQSKMNRATFASLKACFCKNIEKRYKIGIRPSKETIFLCQARTICEQAHVVSSFVPTKRTH